MKKPRVIRNEHDLIRFMGCFPDEISEGPLVSDTGWVCDICKKEYPNNKELPSPCKECGGILFKAMGNP